MIPWNQVVHSLTAYLMSASLSAMQRHQCVLLKQREVSACDSHYYCSLIDSPYLPPCGSPQSTPDLPPILFTSSPLPFPPTHLCDLTQSPLSTWRHLRCWYCGPYKERSQFFMYTILVLDVKLNSLLYRWQNKLVSLKATLGSKLFTYYAVYYKLLYFWWVWSICLVLVSFWSHLDIWRCD